MEEAQSSEKVKGKADTDSLGNAMQIMNNLFQLTEEFVQGNTNTKNGGDNKSGSIAPTMAEKSTTRITFPDLPDPDEFLESIVSSKAGSEPASRGMAGVDLKAGSCAVSGSPAKASVHPMDNAPSTGLSAQPLVKTVQGKGLSSVSATPDVGLVPSKSSSINVFNLASKNSQIVNFINKIKHGSATVQDNSGTSPEPASSKAACDQVTDVKDVETIGYREQIKSAAHELTTNEVTCKEISNVKNVETRGNRAKIKKVTKKVNQKGRRGNIEIIIKKIRKNFDIKTEALLELKSELDASEVETYVASLNECVAQGRIIPLTKPNVKLKSHSLLIDTMLYDVQKIVHHTSSIKNKNQTSDDKLEDKLDTQQTSCAETPTPSEHKENTIVIPNAICEEANASIRDSSQNVKLGNDNTTEENDVEILDASRAHSEVQTNDNSVLACEVVDEQSSSTNTKPIDGSSSTQADVEEDDEIIVLEVPAKVFPLINIPSDDEDSDGPPGVDRAENENSEYEQSFQAESEAYSAPSAHNQSHLKRKSDDDDVPVHDEKRRHVGLDEDVQVVELVVESCDVLTDTRTDVEDVPTDTPGVEVADQARIQDVAILNLINEVKMSSRQHRDQDTKACDSSHPEKAEREDPTQSIPKNGAGSSAKPSIRDRLGSKVSVKDRIGPVQTADLAAGGSIRDRLGDRVEADEDGMLRVHIDNELVAMEDSGLETSALLARSINSAGCDDKLILRPATDDQKEEVFVRQVRIETNPTADSSADHAERNSKLHEDDRSELGSLSDLFGFPVDEDGFQTLSEAESNEGDDGTRRRKRRSAKDRLGDRDASSGDEVSSSRRHSDRPRHSPPHRPHYSRHSPPHRPHYSRHSPPHRPHYSRHSPPHYSRHSPPHRPRRSRSPLNNRSRHESRRDISPRRFDGRERERRRSSPSSRQRESLDSRKAPRGDHVNDEPDQANRYTMTRIVQWLGIRFPCWRHTVPISEPTKNCMQILISTISAKDTFQRKGVGRLAAKRDEWCLFSPMS